jgi:hypothetical protein
MGNLLTCRHDCPERHSQCSRLAGLEIINAGAQKCLSCRHIDFLVELQAAFQDVRTVLRRMRISFLATTRFKGLPSES